MEGKNKRIGRYEKALPVSKQAGLFFRLLHAEKCPKHDRGSFTGGSLRTGRMQLIVKIFPHKQCRMKKFFKADVKTFADFIDNAQLHTRIGAAEDGAQRGLRNAALLI